MNSIMERIAFFCLIPFGIFLLVTGIRLVRKYVNQKILLELPYLQKKGHFTIEKEGTYAIWQKGQLFRKPPTDKFKPQIYNEQTHKEVAVNYSFSKASTNNGITAQEKMFVFNAPAGKYTLELVDGSSVFKAQKLLSGLFPGKPVDLDKYFIQVRETPPWYYLFFGIPLLILSAFSIIAGLALVISAK